MNSQLFTEPAGLEVVTPETAPQLPSGHPLEPWDPFRHPTILRPGSRAGSRPSSMIGPVTEPNPNSPEAARPTSITTPTNAPNPYSSSGVSRPVSIVGQAAVSTDLGKSQLFTEPAGLEVVTPPTVPQQDEGWGPIRTSFHHKIEPDPVYRYSNPNLIEEHRKHMSDFGFTPKEATGEKRKKKGLRRPLCILGVIALVLVIVGAVTGAVLGTRKHSNGADVAPNSPTPTANGTAAHPATSRTSTAQPTTMNAPSVNTNIIKKSSALSVSGERNGDDFTIRLYYQGDDSVIRVSIFDSKSGNWSGPANVTKAPIYTSMTTQSFLLGGSNAHLHQYEMFYVDNKNQLVEWNQQEGSSSSNSKQLLGTGTTTIQDSYLGFYWPNMAYQTHDGEINVWSFDEKLGSWGPAFVSDAVTSDISGLAVIPRALDHTSQSVFFERQNGKLQEYFSGTDMFFQEWTKGVTLDDIPPTTPIAAFSTPGSNSKYYPNMYILWQETDGDIYVKSNMSPDSSAGWTAATTFPALKGADIGTSIACLTPSSSFGIAAVAKSDMCRCYFQVKGAVREVLYSTDTNDWTIVGWVPIS